MVLSLLELGSKHNEMKVVVGKVESKLYEDVYVAQAVAQPYADISAGLSASRGYVFV